MRKLFNQFFDLGNVLLLHMYTKNFRNIDLKKNPLLPYTTFIVLSNIKLRKHEQLIRSTELDLNLPNVGKHRRIQNDD